MVGLMVGFSTGPKCSAVVRGKTSTCNVAEGFETSSTDDVCEWLLVSTSAYLFLFNIISY